MKQPRLLLWVLATCCLSLCFETVLAQQSFTLKGKIIDAATGAPLAGATVTVAGTKLAILANETGTFTLETKMNTRIQVTMVGYETVTSMVTGPELTIQMVAGTSVLEEAIVIGYGTQKRELMSGSVANMKMDEARRTTPTTNLGNLLAGQMAGVRVSTPAGPPGTNPSIVIRVPTSFNAQPVLYVIDGKISDANDFNNLSPNDIDNISALKDAASTAAYGARASGGVIVVTTRRGSRNGKAQINYSFSTGVDKRGKNAPLTSAVETGELYNKINPNGGPVPNWSQSDLDYFKTINGGWGYDQLDAVWQDPYTSAHNLSVSGGGDKIRYFVGGSYIQQGAFMKNLTFDKYNFRVNLTAEVVKNLTLFTGITTNNNLSYTPTNTSVGDVVGIYRKQLLWQPEQPVWTDGGNPIDYGWIGNVGAEVRGDGGYIKSNFLKPIVNLQATYKIPFVEGLSAMAQYNKAYANTRTKTYGKRYDMWVMKTLGSARQISTNDADLVSLKKSSQIGTDYMREDYAWANDYQLNFQLNYDNTFANVHHVKGWLTYERAESTGSSMFGARERFPVYLTDQWWATSGDRLDSYAGGTTEQPIGRKSWVGQFFYDYDSKYLASFTYRYDGSYKFPEDKRWGFFPSGSVGWVISRENFMKNVKGIEMLKLRASAGVTSADNIAGWAYQQSYTGGSSAYFGTGNATNVGIQYGSIVNPDITWEKSRNYNVGLDVHFLKNFNASLEYYNVNTYDILGTRIASVPPTYPRALPPANYGEIHSQGIEFNIGYSNSAGEFNYYANFNASYGAAKYITQDQNITYPWQANPGNSTTRIASYTVVDMIRTQADLDAFVAANPTYRFNGISPALGQLIYADLSGKDGKPDGLVDSWDQSTIKANNNPVSMGLNLGSEWKGFSVDVTFSGNANQWRMVNNLVDGNVEWNRMWKNWLYDGWYADNPNASLPKRYSANDGTRSVSNTASTFWLKDASFIRLRLLNVGYSLPGKYTRKVGIQNVKLYFSGSNLFVWSKFNKDYYDPEMSDPFGYPTMKNFNFGVNVTL